MQISEPVTMLTDYALGAAGLFFAFSLFRIIDSTNRAPVRLWGIGFAAEAIAALAGGAYHGFALHLDASAVRALWNVTTVAIGMSAGFMISGVVASSIRKGDESRVWLIRGLLLTLAGFMVQQTGFRFGLHFNHNDIFHVMQMGALYLFFKGARLLKDPRQHE